LRIGCLANVVVLSVLVAAVIVYLINVRPGVASPADEAAIRRVLADQVAAWNRADLDGFMAGYWNDEGLTFISGGNIRHGWKATKERYETVYQSEGKDKMGQLGFNELHVEGLGPAAAVVRGQYELNRAGKIDRGRFTLLVRKFPDGWKITHDHTSVNCPEPEKPEKK
jgi:beta-aspartyl-peptidase (threonine type)